MFVWNRNFEFDSLGRRYIIKRGDPDGAINGRHAADMLRDLVRHFDEEIENINFARSSAGIRPATRG